MGGRGVERERKKRFVFVYLDHGVGGGGLKIALSNDFDGLCERGEKKPFPNFINNVREKTCMHTKNAQVFLAGDIITRER